MVSLIHAKRDRLRALLTGTDEDEFHDIAVSLLESDDPESVLATLDIVGHSREQSVRLLPAIVNLLSSSQHVPCTNMENPGLGHQSIALAAMRILLGIARAMLPHACAPGSHLHHVVLRPPSTLPGF